MAKSATTMEWKSGHTVSKDSASHRAPLLASNHDFARVFTNVPDLVHSVDGDGVIVYANPTVTELLGYEIDEYLGMRFVDICATSHYSDLAARFQSLTADGELDAVEGLLVSKQGESIPVEIRSLASYFEASGLSSSFSIIRDLRPALAMKEQQRSASRKAAKGELAQYIAHDLRSPLTTLKLQAESLQALEEKEASVDGKLNRISRITSTAVDQIEELLKVLDRNADSPIVMEQCDVAEALQQTVNRVYGASLANNISLETNIKASEYSISMGDKLRLRQLFGNLLNNAVAAVKKQHGGTSNGLIKISLCANEDSIIVDIDDNGVGIDDQNVDKIFTRGFSTRVDPDGTGLGLSICKKIVEEHGGQISLMAADNTVFQVYLPRASCLRKSRRSREHI